MWDLSYYDFVKLSYVSQSHITSLTFCQDFKVTSDQYSISQWTMIGEALYMINLNMSKMSILTQYLRIFVPTRHGNAYMFWYTTALIILNVLFCIIEFFLIIMNCSPQARLWNRKLSGTCIGPGKSSSVFTAGFNIISDVMILVLPLTRVWRLQMSTRRKLGLSLIFSTGLMYGIRYPSGFIR